MIVRGLLKRVAHAEQNMLSQMGPYELRFPPGFLCL